MRGIGKRHLPDGICCRQATSAYRRTGNIVPLYSFKIPALFHLLSKIRKTTPRILSLQWSITFRSNIFASSGLINFNRVFPFLPIQTPWHLKKFKLCNVTNRLEQVMLPDCEKLPPIGSKGSETCFRIGIPHMAQIVEGKELFNYLSNPLKGEK